MISILSLGAAEHGVKGGLQAEPGAGGGPMGLRSGGLAEEAGGRKRPYFSPDLFLQE